MVSALLAMRISFNYTLPVMGQPDSECSHAYLTSQIEFDLCTIECLNRCPLISNHIKRVNLALLAWGCSSGYTINLRR